MPKIGTTLHDAVLNKLALAPRGRVLDVGAGSGELARRLSGLGFQADACDCFPEADWKPVDQVVYRECDLKMGLPYEEESFEYVVCLEVIEHLDDPFALCQEFRRVLRNGGIISVSTPNILSLRSRLKVPPGREFSLF
jgi:2-polyprenyl-3-methyl-5-hydroxy-6-metoxy-1,4-benzoquinol methylase